MENKVYLDSNFKKIASEIENSIEIDEQIADLIIDMNKKGYTTTACCSGHYKENTSYEQLISKTVSSKEDLIKWLNENNLKFLREDNENYYYEGKILGQSCYISFNEHIILPFYPDNFEIDTENNGVIRRIEYYNDEIGIDKKDKETIEQEINNAMNDLKIWVEKLPSLK